MYIDPVECSNCGNAGRPGEKGFQAASGRDITTIHCECGEQITLRGQVARDQNMLSTNIVSRLAAASNHYEWGSAKIIPGYATEVSFSKSFDLPCKVFLTPAKGFAHVKERDLTPDGMTILTSVADNDFDAKEDFRVNWGVFGLVDIDSLPAWYLHFYTALTNLENGFFKPALLDYAVAFEVFLGTVLSQQLTLRFGSDVAEYLLKRASRVDERVKGLLEIAIGTRLTAESAVFQPWDKQVRNPRNRLAHGERLSIDHDAALKAHSATYQAIRWIQDQNA